MTTDPALLPAASILKKLDDVCPGSASRVLDRAEKIAEQRRAESNIKPTLRERFRHFVRGMSEGMVLHVPSGTGHDPVTTPEQLRYYREIRIDNAVERLRDVWAQVGDDLRAGIRDEMAARKLTAADIGLNDTEIQDLTVRAATGPRPAR